MNTDGIIFTDSPSYNIGFLKAVAAATLVIILPIFLVVFSMGPEHIFWWFLILFSVPIIILAIPPLLIVPAIVTLTNDRISVKHGFWTMRIPLSEITYYNIVSYPPSSVNNQYMFPNAEWVEIRKEKGLNKSWYIPVTSATRLMVAIQSTITL